MTDTADPSTLREPQGSGDNPRTRLTFDLNRLDALARSLERKWGVGRLPLLVSPDLAERFYSQWRKSNAALKDKFPDNAIVQIGRMITAWQTLDAEADRLNAPHIDPTIIEATLANGKIIAIVRDFDEAASLQQELRLNHSGRDVTVYAASEIARLIEATPITLAVKQHWPGATIKPTRLPDDFWEHGDEIPF